MKGILLSFLLITGFFCSSQQIIIPKGTIPTIDGVISPGEWADADSVNIQVQLPPLF